MILTIFDIVTFKFSKVLESLFDAIEYRLAMRAFRHAAGTAAKERSRTNVAKHDPGNLKFKASFRERRFKVRRSNIAPFSGV